MFEELFARSGLSLDRLRSFLAFAQKGSIAKAAPGDVNLQSQMSRQISELEAFFATELTVRRGKSLAASEAGARLALLIQQQLQDLEDFRREQAQLKKAFTIGAGASLLEWLVVPALSDIRAALGEATVSLDTRRSRALVEAVQEGRLDFAVVRENALSEKARRLPLLQVRFHLCVPKRLLGRGMPAQRVLDPALWQKLPFTAGKDGGQLDATIRQAMRDAGVDFRPVVECTSMLQSRQVIERGECAGVLPSVGLHGLAAKHILIREFPPLKDYGHRLVLHWNERQLRRRGLEEAAVRQIAAAIQKGAEARPQGL